MPSACCRERLRAFPNDVAAMRMLAELGAGSGATAGAGLLERCLALAPGFAMARHNYALVLGAAIATKDALVEVEACWPRMRTMPAYQNLKAVVRWASWATTTVRSAVSRSHKRPKEPRLWMSLGHARRPRADRARDHRLPAGD
jgi:hypothetical protein